MNDQKVALAGAIYERLKERIMDQVYPPRERLNVDALAADLSVSPTPVREANTVGMTSASLASASSARCEVWSAP